MTNKLLALLLPAALTIAQIAEAKKPRQIPDWYPDKDSLYRAVESIPPFGIYKDNYIVTGTSFSGGRVTKDNSDAKFQISLRHRLIKSILPLHTYLFLTYTQKSFWEIYKDSKPFYENNYNPTLGFGMPITRGDKVVGVGFLQFEHESNGRDSIWSRSWNRITLQAIYEIDPHFTVQAKFWIPFALSDNPHIVRYAGYGQVAGTYKTRNERFRFSMLVVKRGGWNLNANFQMDAAFRLSKISNQYIYLQYYNGLRREHDRLRPVSQLPAHRVRHQTETFFDLLTFRSRGGADATNRPAKITPRRTRARPPASAHNSAPVSDAPGAGSAKPDCQGNRGS